jgi:hypothetical protein
MQTSTSPLTTSTVSPVVGTRSVLASYRIPSNLSQPSSTETNRSAHIPRQMPGPIFSTSHYSKDVTSDTSKRPATSSGSSSTGHFASLTANGLAMDPPPPRRVSTGSTFPSVFELPNPKSPRKNTFFEFSGLGIGPSTARAASEIVDTEEVDMLAGDSGGEQSSIPRPGLPRKRKPSQSMQSVVQQSAGPASRGR